MNNEYKRWLASDVIDPATKAELKDNEDEIESRFSAPMSFGTAGLRSLMGAGISRMNVYTVSQATRGVADLVIGASGKDKGVAIAYDSRYKSRLFAHISACVLAENGIKVYLFENIRPTPELSFAILRFGCIAGINITASHNTKEYNGYKVYWSDGAQLPPEHAEKVAEAMKKYDVLSPVSANITPYLENGTITYIGTETDEAYLKCVLGCRIDPDVIKKYGDSLELLYTPLHGTGYLLVPEAMRRAGISNLRLVPEQDIPDGGFPTVKSPNPENKECFGLALDFIKKQGLATNVIIATDPDGDRLGVAVKGSDGEFAPLSGNQIGALLIDYIIRSRKAKGKLPANAAAIRSAVSSTLFDKICEKNGVTPVVVLTGFKYIGEKIKEYAANGEHTFIFGYEESQGFLSDSYARDKDGVAAALLIAEAACYYKSVGKTLREALDDIYAEYGLHAENTMSIAISGVVPMVEMQKKMASLRSASVTEINGCKVTVKGDCAVCKEYDLVNGTEKPTGLPEADMLYYKTTDGTTVVIRPSGTEPKVKAYILVNGKDKAETDGKIDAVKAQILELFK